MISEKALNTKENIFNAAVKIFAQKGFSGATTSEIAKEANIAEGTIFRYYKTKKDLLRGIMFEYVDRFDEILDINSLERILEENNNKPLEDALKILLLNRYEVIEKSVDLFKILMYEMQFHEDIKKIHCEKVISRQDKLTNFLINKIVNQEEFRDIGQKRISRIFQSIIIAVFYSAYEEQNNPNFSIEKEIEIAVDVLLNGLRKR